MFIKLLLLFTGIPLVELAILIKIGTYIGTLATIGLVILTGIIGASLARIEGFRVLNRIRESINRGEMPAEELVDGLLILSAGLTLITPGLLTDALGFLILIPVTREIFKGWLRRKFQKWIQDKSRVVIVDTDFY